MTVTTIIKCRECGLFFSLLSGSFSGMCYSCFVEMARAMKNPAAVRSRSEDIGMPFKYKAVFYPITLSAKAWEEIEVKPCVLRDNGGVEVCLESEAQFWGVYLRQDDGTAICAADCQTREMGDQLKRLLLYTAITWIPKVD